MYCVNVLYTTLLVLYLISKEINKRKGKYCSFKNKEYFLYHITLPVIAEGNKIITSLGIKQGIKFLSKKYVLAILSLVDLLLSYSV